MKVVLAVFVALLIVVRAWAAAPESSPPAASEPETSIPVSCHASGICLVSAQTLAQLAAAHNAHVERIRQLEAELKEAGQKKKCARLEVTS